MLQQGFKQSLVRTGAVAGALLSFAITPSVRADNGATTESQDDKTLLVTLDAAPLTLSTPIRLRRSYPAAIAESAGVLAGFNIVARLIGKDYARFTLSSIGDNLTSKWVWDEDAFSTNQFGHPYMGSLYFSAARSNGLGFYSASIVTYASSLVWELAMETEIPSINDQIVTPLAGIFFGEILHRWSRSILWTPNGGKPGVIQTGLAAIIDPLGTINRHTLGEAWSLNEPPPRFGWLAAGWSGLSTTYDDGADVSRDSLLYAGFQISYGLPTTERFRPRRPMDHFDARLEGSIGKGVAYATLRLRGLLYGREFGGSRLRGIWGAYGSYDFDSPERLRVSTVGVGVGTTINMPIRKNTFLQGTAIASIVPYGTAGGDVPSDSLDRDYHRGPGVSQLLELKLGKRGLGMLTFSLRNYEINGARFNEGFDNVSIGRLGGLFGFAKNHAVGIEAGVGVRHARFNDAPNVTDGSGQLRIYYALIQDLDFGGGAGD